MPGALPTPDEVGLANGVDPPTPAGGMEVFLGGTAPDTTRPGGIDDAPLEAVLL